MPKLDLSKADEREDTLCIVRTKADVDRLISRLEAAVNFTFPPTRAHMENYAMDAEMAAKLLREVDVTDWQEEQPEA